MRPAARLALVAPAVAALSLLTILLPLADREADRGWAAYAASDFAVAAARYEAASNLLPISHHYASEQARALIAAGAEGDRRFLVRAKQVLERIDREHGLSSGEAIDLATVRIGLSDPVGETVTLIDRAASLNPHGVATESYTATLRQAAREGGILVYSKHDRWVFVVPGAAAREPR